MSNEHGSDSSEEEFILVNADVPHRPKAPNDDDVPANTDVAIRLQPISATKELLIGIQPPEKPTGELHHTSCDIVLVIDVSGSMDAAAELPDNAGTDKKESSGLSILDLVKHAARTVLENLSVGDRLAVVVFSDDATRVQGLLPMTESAKKETWKRIEVLRALQSTNLWSGIKEGLDVFDTTDHIGNVQGMFILTDGAPNHMCPSQGYVKKLQPMLREIESTERGAPFLSTFGFGYNLRSDLLRSIAEVGKGKYAFIPDSGMIGTVFVHAVANLFATFATSVKLRLETENKAAKVSASSYLGFDAEGAEQGTLLHIGNLQYGQSRDIIVKLEDVSGSDVFSATLQYCGADQVQKTAVAQKRLSDRPTIPKAAVDYHVSRYELCNFLAGLSTRNKNDEHVAILPKNAEKQAEELGPLIARIKDRLSAAHKAGASEGDIHNITSLLADLEDQDSDIIENPHGAGQISLALQTNTRDLGSHESSTRRQSHRASPPSFYERWGRHYLPAILHAHMQQQCATFKDPGPLCYGSKSPLFIKCRDELDDAFDRLPAPKPSLKGRNVQGGIVRMSRYNFAGNPCFAGHCEAKMGDGASGYELRVDELGVGDIVWTPAGGRMVREIVKTDVTYAGGQMMCNIREKDSSDEGLWITPYHPVEIDGKWRFPINVARSDGHTNRMETGYVYSIMLERDEYVNAHAIDVGGIICLTLGHGLTQGTGHTDGTDDVDVRVHPYFGDYDRIATDLERLGKDDCSRRVSGGIVKDVGSSMATRFVRPDETARSSSSPLLTGHL